MKLTAIVQRHLEEIARHRLPRCGECESVGTIVQLGACCLIARWIEMGSLWEEDVSFARDPQPARLPSSRRPDIYFGARSHG